MPRYGEDVTGAVPADGRKTTDDNGNPTWGGYGQSIQGGRYVPGTSAAEMETARYRSMGEAAANRGVYTMDYNRANAAANQLQGAVQGADTVRNRQNAAADLTLSAARGGQPSRATLASSMAVQQGLGSQLAAQGGARSSLGMAAANRGALTQGADLYAANVGAAGTARAGEIGNAQTSYGQQVGNMRGADIQTAGNLSRLAATQNQMANAQGAVVMDQRNLDQGLSQFYEDQAFRTQAADLGAKLQSRATTQGIRQFDAGVRANEDDRFKSYYGAALGAGSSMGAGLAVAGGGGGAPQGGGGYGNYSGGIYRTDPYGSGERFSSDERAKVPLDGGVLPLYEPEGSRLQQSADGHASLQRIGDVDDGRPSLARASAGRAPEPVSVAKAASRAPAAGAKPRKMTLAEIEKAAKELERETMSTGRARLAAGPSVGVDSSPLADANRAMRGQPYAYKPGEEPPHEMPGQPHHGFMAQNLERSPVAATAVEVDPQTGMRTVDRDRMLQVVASGLSDLQRQQDETRMAQAAMLRRRIG